jgi:cyclic-di-GMP-binding protein
MPSFDIVSEINQHELVNAIDQANREVTTRFDFKDSGAIYTQEKEALSLKAQTEFQIKQMFEILVSKLVKRGIDIKCLKEGKIETSLHEARQKITIQQGIDKEFAKTITKLIKDSQTKVQSSIQGEQIRVTGKKRDDLQSIIAVLKAAPMELPVQFVNFRD